MTFAGINLTVPHTLSRELAFERVLTWLEWQQSKSWFVHVDELETIIRRKELTLSTKIELTVLGHKESHTLTFKSDQGAFHVTSDPADNRAEALEMMVEQSQLTTQLTEVLK